VPSLVILVSRVFVLSCRQTDRQIDRITEADQHYAHSTTIGVNNGCITKVLVAKCVEQSFKFGSV